MAINYKIAKAHSKNLIEDVKNDEIKLIQKYQEFSKYLDNSELNTNETYLLKAHFISDALQSHYLSSTLNSTLSKGSLSKYMIKELLQDSQLLHSINKVSKDINISLDKLCTLTIILANDEKELVQHYKMIANAIDNSSLTSMQKNDLKESYISCFLPNTIDSVTFLSESHSKILQAINELDEDIKLDLKDRYQAQYSRYSNVKQTLSAQSVFEKMQSKTSQLSNQDDKYLKAVKKVENSNEEQDQNLEDTSGNTLKK
jgi:hypothetical protein